MDSWITQQQPNERERTLIDWRGRGMRSKPSRTAMCTRGSVLGADPKRRIVFV